MKTQEKTVNIELFFSTRVLRLLYWHEDSVRKMLGYFYSVVKKENAKIALLIVCKSVSSSRGSSEVLQRLFRRHPWSSSADVFWWEVLEMTPSLTSFCSRTIIKTWQSFMSLSHCLWKQGHDMTWQEETLMSTKRWTKRSWRLNRFLHS